MRMRMRVEAAVRMTRTPLLFPASPPPPSLTPHHNTHTHQNTSPFRKKRDGPMTMSLITASRKKMRLKTK